MNVEEIADTAPIPGANLDLDKMPGHWLLARLGKRVLRPGGVEATRALLCGLNITAQDDVIELAPGLGSSARMILDYAPASYVGIERDAAAANFTRRHLADRDRVSVAVGSAADTGLADNSASVALGEAMLTMNTPAQKARIVAEVFRVLKPGGRYGIHELCLAPDDIDKGTAAEITQALQAAIRVGALPLSAAEWAQALSAAGFAVSAASLSPMHLLKPRRVIQDEGLRGALTLAKNLITNPPARRRVLGMRGVFNRYQQHLSAITLVARKPG